MRRRIQCKREGCRVEFDPGAGREFCSGRCRTAAWRRAHESDKPLMIRHIETATAAEIEAALLAAFARRRDYGWGKSDPKAILIRVANRLGTDQPRRAGRFV